MKTVILAGGFGTRLAEETQAIPKPMVEIGGRPILWHIMELYGRQGFKNFLIACGYKGEEIKAYFNSYFYRHNDWRINLSDGSREITKQSTPDWTIDLVDTGLNTMTAGRLLRLADHLKDGTFMVTYGDGLSDVNIKDLVAFHRSHGKLATVTTVRPQARFGAIELDGDEVASFTEKPQTESGWINGGFFVFEPKVLDYMIGDDMPLERKPLENIANDRELVAYRHNGFWQPMDTLRDKRYLNSLWDSGNAPWTADLKE